MISVKEFKQLLVKKDLETQQKLTESLLLLEKEIDIILSSGKNIISTVDLTSFALINSNTGWYVKELNRIYSPGGWRVIRGYRTLEFVTKEEDSVEVN